MPEMFRRLSPGRLAAAIMLSLLIVLTLAFIFGNSLDDRQESAEKSARFERIVEPVLRALPYDRLHTREALATVTRKLAHYAEFFLLGAQIMALAILTRQVPPVRKRFILLFCLVIACADELLQFVSLRAPRVQDALLDTFGALCGILFVHGVYRLLCGLKSAASKGGVHA